MRFCERRMMSLERKGIKGRGRAAYNKGLRNIRERKKEKVTGDSRKYSLRISIFCVHHPRNCRVVKFKIIIYVGRVARMNVERFV